MHNNRVLVLDYFNKLHVFKDFQHISSFSTETKCILFAGKIRAVEESSRGLASDPCFVQVATGTVFNTIVVWGVDINENVTKKPENCQNLENSKNPENFKTLENFKNNTKSTEIVLKGHNGAVFHVEFYENNKKLLSSADDRSVRIWCLETKNCLKTLFGHTSRVWQVIKCGKYRLVL